jgi:hypothetical protein
VVEVFGWSGRCTVKKPKTFCSRTKVECMVGGVDSEDCQRCCEIRALLCRRSHAS